MVIAYIRNSKFNSVFSVEKKKMIQHTGKTYASAK